MNLSPTVMINIYGCLQSKLKFSSLADGIGSSVSQISLLGSVPKPTNLSSSAYNWAASLSEHSQSQVDFVMVESDEDV